MATSKSGHLDRTATEPRDKELLDVKISMVQQINDSVRLFRLSLADPIQVLAGQWLDTYVPETKGAGGFTISSPPSAAAHPTNPYFELAIQASPQNPHAAWLWRPRSQIMNHMLHVRVGGSFIYPPKRPYGPVQRVVLIAGGVGVNPLVSMLGEIRDRGEDVEVKILYGSKMPRGGLQEVPFLQRMAKMLQGDSIQGSMDLFLTGSATLLPSRCDLPKWFQSGLIELHEGRMTSELVKATIGSGATVGTIVYICGPASMTDELADVVSRADDGVIEADRVMTEKWW